MEKLKITGSKKVLGVVLDSLLNFKDHIQEKTKAEFAALRSRDSFAPVLVSALTECCKEFGKIQCCAMVKASGCLSSTSTDTLEVLTNATPIDLHLKMRQAQEVVRISAKYDDEPIREEFNAWIGGGHTVGRKPTIFHMLMCQFREMSGRLEFDSIEKYSKDLMELIKEKGKIDVEGFKNTKTDQVENIREILGQIDENEVVAFTDGLALGNQGPTGASERSLFTHLHISYTIL